MRTTFTQMWAAADRNGWILERDRRVMNGVTFYYTLNDNAGMEAICRDLDEVSDTIWEWANRIS